MRKSGLRFASIGTSLLLLGVALLPVASPAVAETRLPPTLIKQIAKDYPRARVLRRGSLSSLCVDVPDVAAGAIRTDFDGDGNDDFAVLLNLGRSKEKAEPGETLYDIALVAYMAKKGGGFAASELDRFEGFALAFWLREQPEGEVRDLQSGEAVTLRNPGVYVDYCGGGAVHYWQGGKFRDIETGD